VLIQNASAKIEQDQRTLESNQLLLSQKQVQKIELRADISEMELVIADIETARDTYVAALVSLNNKGQLMNGDLDAIVDNVVTNLELHRISHDVDQLILTGQASTEDEVMQYVRNLQDTGRFSEITISSLTRVSDNDDGTDFMSYTLALRLGRG
jgi:hypothetical protein